MDNKVEQSDLDNYLFNDPNSLNPELDSKDILYIKYPNNVQFIFEKIKILGFGKYGIIYLYKYKNLKYALKFSKSNLLECNEYKAAVELHSSKFRDKKIFTVIDSKIVICENKSVILMPAMDASTDDLNLSPSKFTDRKITIITNIRQQMESIINLNSNEIINDPKQENFKFAYLDLKPSNVLYKRTTPRTYILGDLGSIVEYDKKILPGIFVSTHLIQLPEFKKAENFCSSHIVKCMRFVFGLFTLLLMTNEYDNFYKRITIPLTKKELTNYNKKLVKIMGRDFANLIIDITRHRISMFG